MAKICIICSSPGDYDLYAPIPAYLHASPNEFLLWPKHVSKMLEETTGLLITSDDKSLPNKICALCISYLKHAATFRQQAIDNILNLKTAQLLNNFDKTNINKDSIISKEDQLNFSQSRCSDLKNIASKPEANKCDELKTFIISPTNAPKPNMGINNTQQISMDNGNSLFFDKNFSNNYYNSNNNHCNSDNNYYDNNSHLNTYLNLLFDKETNKTACNYRRNFYNQFDFDFGNDINEEVCSNELENEEIVIGLSDDNEVNNCEVPNFFNYKEKNFEEDDIINDINDEKKASVVINIPKVQKERKCPACFKRFMFEDSFEDHTSACIEFHLINFIEDANRLLEIRRNKAISPHEFVRRMIFSLKKVGESLKLRGENINIPSQSDYKKNPKPIAKKPQEQFTPNMILEPVKSTFNSNTNEKSNFKPIKSGDINKENLKQNSNNKKYNYKPNPNRNNNIRARTPDFKHNPRNSFDNTFKPIQQHNNGRMINTPMSSTVRALCTPPLTHHFINNHYFKNKLNKYHINGQFNTVLLTPVGRLTTTENYRASPSPILSFSARCSMCNENFENLGALENHNAKFHNYQLIEKEEHKKIIALFEDE